MSRPRKNRLCSLSACEKPHEAMGYCRKHYYRYKKFGTTEIEKPREMHGMFGTPTYSTWASMVQRTTDKNYKRYEYWGGRGIKMCDEWRKSFLAFYRDMGERPEGMSIDRIDNDGNYEPSNCRWATASQQGFNQRMKGDNTSGHTGVFWRKQRQRWIALIRINGELHYLGSSKNFDEAVKLREDAVAKLDL